MNELIFALKMLAATITIVLLLQISWGGKTAEDHIQNWIHEANIMGTVRQAAHGGARMLDETGNWLGKWSNDPLHKARHKNQKAYGSGSSDKHGEMKKAHTSGTQDDYNDSEGNSASYEDDMLGHD